MRGPVARRAALRRAEVSRAVARFDTGADKALDRLRGRPAADRLFYGVSELADHSLVWLILGAVRGLRSEHDWGAAVRVGTGVFVESALVNLGIKSVFRRSRPPWEIERPLRLRRPLTSSFPSGHATSAFCAAGLLADDDPLWPGYYALAVLIATSRVYVGVHHASDIVAGVAIGVVLGRIGRAIAPLPARPTGLAG
ncbi:MAG: phosphatase PAP2 family protein [Acidimicrobiales bacterium]